MITSDAAVLCTWQSSSWWQCRQMTAFSSRKKLRMPAAIVSIAGRAGSVAERFGHQRQQRDADQRADRIADQPRHQPDADLFAEKQKAGGDDDAAQRAENRQADGDAEQSHASKQYTVCSRQLSRSTTQPTVTAYR